MLLNLDPMIIADYEKQFDPTSPLQASFSTQDTDDEYEGAWLLMWTRIEDLN